MKINVDFIYPIGSVYISTESTNPGVLFGGTWQQTAKSRAIVGAGSNIANTRTTYGVYAAGTLNLQAGELIGEPWVTLDISEIPAHTHSSVKRNTGTDDSNFSGHVANACEANDTDTTKDTLTTGSAGGGNAHNNIMPAEVYYIWKRVS